MALYYFVEKRDAPTFLLAIVALVCYALLPCVSTILVGRIFSAFTAFASGSDSSDAFLSDVTSYASGLFSNAALSLTLGAVAHSLWLYLGYLQGHRARLQLYQAVVSSSSEWHDTRSKSSTSINITFKDVVDLESGTGVETFEAIKAVITVIASLGVALYYSWQVTLVSLAGFPLLILSTSILGPKIATQMTLSKKVMDKLSEKIGFVLSALQTVRIFGHEDLEADELHNEFLQQQSIDCKRWHFFQAMEGIARFIILAMFVQGFFFGSHMVKTAGLDSGNVMTVFWSCLTVAGAAQEFLNSLVSLQKGEVSAGRLLALVNVDEEQKLKDSIGLKPELKEAPSIDFDEVVFAYPTRPELVFTDLTLHLEGGKTHFIAGPSGHGKSSIGLLLAGQYHHQAGFVKIAGFPVEHLSRDWIEQNVALVQQNTKLFSISIADNVRIGSRTPQCVSDQTVRLALREMYADFVFDLPDEIHTTSLSGLSGGQIQRIILARAWISDAPIMIFDECTSSLDDALSRNVMRKIREFRKDKTTLFISHDLSLVDEKDTLCVVEDGFATYYGQSSHCDWLESNRHTVYEDFQGFQPDKIISDNSSDSTECVMIEEKEANVTPVESTVSLVTLACSNFKTTLALFKRQRSKTAMVLAFLVVSAHSVINPVFAYVFSNLLMGLVPNSGVNVVKWAMLVLLCAFLDGFTAYLKVFVHMIAQYWQTEMRDDVLWRLLAQTSLPEDRVSVYRKLLVSDFDKIIEIITVYWVGLTQVFTIALVGIIWAISQGWKLTLVGCSLVPVIGLFSCYFKDLTERWNRKRERNRLTVISLMDDVMSNFRVIKSNNLEKYFGNIYRTREDALWKVSKASILRLSLGYGFIQLFSPLIQGLLLYYGMKLTSTGEYTPSKTMLVFALLVFTLVTLDGVLSSIPNLGSGFEAATRLIAIIEKFEKPNRPDKTLEWDHEMDLSKTITIRDATLSSSDVKIFDSLDLIVDEGSITAFVGPSGCGKTSLARCLMGLQYPTAGEIYFGSEEIHTISATRLRNKVTMVEQMPLKLFEGTLYENIVYGLGESDHKLSEVQIINIVTKAAEAVGLHSFISQLENQYDTVVKPGLLSGGQIQRVGIARGLVRNPSILILDEPTSALDHANREIIKDLILRLRDTTGCTVILISHQDDVVEIADKVYRLPQRCLPQKIEK